MLKRTKAHTVANLLPEFILRFPNFEKIFQCEIDELIFHLKPLGLQNQRSIHFKKLSKSILTYHAGSIPLDENILKTLDGIGEYTANAVTCFCTGKALPIIDTNVIKVLKAYFGIKPDANDERRSKNIKELAHILITSNPQQSKLINRGLLDMGAFITNNPQDINIKQIIDSYI